MLSQKEAVFQAITNVTNFNGEGVCTLTSEQRKQVSAILVEGFKSNSIRFDGVVDESISKYTPGLIANWLRKDKRLNGGIKHEAKNPGSRTGQSDPQLKALNAALSLATSPEDKAEVQEYINARKFELNLNKTPKKTINFDVLPEALRAKFNK